MNKTQQLIDAATRVVDAIRHDMEDCNHWLDDGNRSAVIVGGVHNCQHHLTNAFLELVNDLESALKEVEE